MSLIFSTSKNELVSNESFVIFLLHTLSANLLPTINIDSLKSHFNNFSINGSVIEYGSAEISLSQGGIYTFKAFPYITSILLYFSFKTFIKHSKPRSSSIQVTCFVFLANNSVITPLPGPISTILVPPIIHKHQ